MKKKPQRMCVVCKSKRDKKDLLRVVLLPDGSVEFDPTGKKAGRGSYLCRSTECITAELKAHKLSRGLHHAINGEELKALAESILKECEGSSYGSEED